MRQRFPFAEVAICTLLVSALLSIGLVVHERFGQQSKTTEATATLRTLFVGAASYYAADLRRGRRTLRHCTVGDAATPNTPGSSGVITWPRSFTDLSVGSTDRMLYRYTIAEGSPGNGGTCQGNPDNTNLYTFSAFGDLDGDQILSTFELAVGSNATNELYRAPGFYIVQEAE